MAALLLVAWPAGFVSVAAFVALDLHYAYTPNASQAYTHIFFKKVLNYSHGANFRQQKTRTGRVN